MLLTQNFFRSFQGTLLNQGFFSLAPLSLPFPNDIINISPQGEPCLSYVLTAHIAPVSAVIFGPVDGSLSFCTYSRQAPHGIQCTMLPEVETYFIFCQCPRHITQTWRCHLPLVTIMTFICNKFKSILPALTFPLCLKSHIPKCLSNISIWQTSL